MGGELTIETGTRTTRQDVRKDTQTIPAPADNYRILHPTTAEYTFVSSTVRTSSRRKTTVYKKKKQTSINMKGLKSQESGFSTTAERSQKGNTIENLAIPQIVGN